jgi:hypothetical protein
MTPSSRQGGFVGAGVMDLVFLLFLIAIGAGLWQWFSAILTGDLATAVFLLWLMAAAGAYWYTREQMRVLRLPTGAFLFVALCAALFPLSVWSGNKIVAACAAGAAVVVAKYAGAWWSRRLRARHAEQSGSPWYLDQSINLFDDLFRWLGLSAVAGLLTGVVAPLAGLMFSVDAGPWAAMVIGFGMTGFFLLSVRKSRLRFLGLTPGVWSLPVAVVVLMLLQKQLVGPLEPGSMELAYYVAFAPVVIALFIDVVAIGTPKPPVAAVSATQ